MRQLPAKWLPHHSRTATRAGVGRDSCSSRNLDSRMMSSLSTSANPNSTGSPTMRPLALACGQKRRPSSPPTRRSRREIEPHSHAHVPEQHTPGNGARRVRTRPTGLPPGCCWKTARGGERPVAVHRLHQALSMCHSPPVAQVRSQIGCEQVQPRGVEAHAVVSMSVAMATGKVRSQA